MFEALWLLCAAAFLAAATLLLSLLHRWLTRGRTVQEARGSAAAFVPQELVEVCPRCGWLKLVGGGCDGCDRRAA